MAKKQTRKSISVSKATYEQMKEHCAKNGVSMSWFTENAIAAQFKRIEETKVTPAPPTKFAPLDGNAEA